MIAPTRRLVGLVLAGGVFAVAPSITDERLWALWLCFVLAVAAAAAADAVVAPRVAEMTPDVETPAFVAIGDTDTLLLRLSSPASRGDAYVEGLVELDEEMAPLDPFRVRLPSGGEATVERTLRPSRRGAPRVRNVWLRWTGPMRLMSRTVRHEPERVVRVAPNVRAVRSAALRYFQNREFLSGLKVERFVGEGSEFEALREYVPGYDHRSIDWRASARHTRLLVREFRAERHQNVVLAFDTGHLMGEPMDGIPKLDHAINAALLLAYVSLRTDDRVGLVAFDEETRAFVEPLAGVTAMARVQQTVADLAYSSAETNFTRGLTDLTVRLRRRSLVVLFTDFVDSVTAELLLDNAGRLARRHVVLFVALRDASLDALSGARPDTLRDLNRAVVAGDLVRERDVVLRRLARLGVLVLDAAPKRLSADLINRYLDIKRRELVS